MLRTSESGHSDAFLVDTANPVGAGKPWWDVALMEAERRLRVVSVSFLHSDGG